MGADAGASTALCLRARLGSHRGVLVGAGAHGGPGAWWVLVLTTRPGLGRAREGL